MFFPQGENRTDWTASICHINGPIFFVLLCRHHTIMLLSSDPDTRYWPSGENETERTDPVCPSNQIPSYFPLSASHRHGAWSSERGTSPLVQGNLNCLLDPDPDAMSFPSGENSTELTGLLLSTSDPQISSPVNASHFLTIQSFDPETIYFPSGENATLSTCLSLPPSSISTIILPLTALQICRTLELALDSTLGSV